MLILLSSFVFAIPPFTPEEFSDSLTIQTLKIDNHVINTSYNLHVHLYNTTDGLTVNNTEGACTYDLYSENMNWMEQSAGGLLPDGLDFNIVINESNFTQSGDYFMIVDCNTSTVGGFISFSFTVYDDENFENTTNFQNNIFILVILIALVVLSLATKQALLGILTSVGVVIYSISLFSLSVMIGLITFVAGIFLMLYFLMVEM